MDKPSVPSQANPAPLGGIEPHSDLLTLPPDGQILYKVMTVENLLRSIDGAYLYFNRVDSYSDSPISDPHDGRQLPADLPGNQASRFQKVPDFSVADYYDRCRARTYACCFGLESADYLWANYANGSERGKVCLVLDFSKLRARLNHSLDPEQSRLLYDGVQCTQIFSVNYGVVQYVEWDRHQANADHLPNPITYTFMKAKRFDAEKELRVALSAPGIGQFALDDRRQIAFPTSLQAPFDFRAAIAEVTIQQVLRAPETDAAFLQSELERRGIGVGIA
jgi:hypothetical protein